MFFGCFFFSFHWLVRRDAEHARRLSPDPAPLLEVTGGFLWSGSP